LADGHVERTRPFGAAGVTCSLLSPPGAATSAVEMPYDE
jgi:hypothetical protein